MPFAKLILLFSALLSFATFPLCAAPENQSPSALDVARQLNEAFVSVAERVAPSVVVINVTSRLTNVFASLPIDTNSLPNDFLHRRFHSPERDDHEPFDVRGHGSGVIIRKDGFILTNGHVVEEADEIEVRLASGRRFKATVRGVDRTSDLAVLKIEADDLPAAPFADSTRTRVGEFAIAIGAPFNLDHSFTFGHVSAKGRSRVIPWGAAMDQDFIQTDASINPGNSGGPLVNIEGQIIGINTLINGLQTGIGFAIPSNLAREVSDQLIAHGRVTRAWLGIAIKALRDEPEFEGLSEEVTDGVIVDSILRGGPAVRSELRADDVILTVDGVPVATAQQLRNEMRGKAIGKAVTLNVARGTNRMNLEIRPGEHPEAAAPFRRLE